MRENTNVTLNLQSPNIAVVVYAVQGDQSARHITAKLMDGSTPWTPPANSTAVVRYLKPDGTVGFYDTDDNSQPAITINGSVADITIVEQATAVPGDVFMQLNFFASDNTRLTSFAWILRVQESVMRDQQIVSSDYFAVLTQAIANGAAVAQQLTFPVPVANGGTGAATAAAARSNLGLDLSKVTALTQSNVTDDDVVRQLPLGIYQVSASSSIAPYIPFNYGTIAVLPSGGANGYGFALAVSSATSGAAVYVRHFRSTGWQNDWTQL